MRKFLAVAAVAVLALAVAVPAMALDFKFGGEYRVRFYTYSNVGFDEDAPNSNPRGAQVRVRPRFDASDDNGNITATLRLEIGDVEFGNGGGDRTGRGSGGSLGTDGVNVETKWAYIDAMFPFGVPLRVRAGLQPWYLPKGLIVDDDVAGVRFYGTTGPIGYDLSWYRISGGPATNAATTTTLGLQCTVGGVTFIVANAASCTALGGTAGTSVTATTPGGTQITTSNAYDNNYDFYHFKVDAAVAKWLNPGAYFVYGMNKATTNLPGPGGGTPAESYYFGFTAAGDLGFMRYDLDFVYGSAEGGPAGTIIGPDDFRKVKGWVLDAGVHFPIGPLVLNLGGSYATGDKQDGGDLEAMPFISPSWHGPGNMMFELIGNGGTFDPVVPTQAGPGGLWTLGASLEYRPVKALWLKAGYLYASFTENDANCAFASGNPCFGFRYPALAGESTLGHELMLRADWDVWTGFKVQSQIGALIPSKGDTVLEFALQMLYNF